MNREEAKRKIEEGRKQGIPDEAIYKYLTSKGFSFEPKKTLGQKIIGAAEKVVDFLGGRAVTDVFASEIARAKAKTPQEKALIEAQYPSVKQTVGSALQLGSLFVPVGAVARGTTMGARALGLGANASRILGNVGAGVATGATFDIGQKLQTGSTNGLATIAGGAIPLAGPVVKLATRGAGLIGSEILGKTTGVGTGAIREGFSSALAGGERAQAFRSALRGQTTPEKLVEEARGGLETLLADRRNTYQQQLAKIAENKQSLDISPIIKAVGDNLDRFNINVLPNGTLDFSRSTLRFNKVAMDDITTIVNEMRGFGLKEGDRTAIGVDRLKQALGDLYSPSGASRAFVQSVKNETRKVLSQVKGYDELAGQYADKTDLIKEITRGLSLGDKASVDTAFRKLTTALRQNNEFRRELVNELDSATNGYLSTKIAGQQLSEKLPRGLSGVLGTIGGVGALSTGIGIAKLLPAVIAFSPRAVGELVSALGFTGKIATDVTEYLLKNIGKLSAPGDKALQGIKGDIQTIKSTPNKQGGFAKNPFVANSSSQSSIPTKGLNKSSKNNLVSPSSESSTKAVSKSSGAVDKLTVDVKDHILKTLDEIDLKKPYIVNGKPLPEVDSIDAFKLEDLQSKMREKSLSDKDFREAARILKQEHGIDVYKEVNNANTQKTTFKQNPKTGKMEGSVKAYKPLLEQAKGMTKEKFVKGITDSDADIRKMKNPGIDIVPISRIKISSYQMDAPDISSVKYAKEQIKSGKGVEPVVVREDYSLLDGRHRMQAFRDLGIKEIAVMRDGGKTKLLDIWEQANKGKKYTQGGFVQAFKDSGDLTTKPTFRQNPKTGKMEGSVKADKSLPKTPEEIKIARFEFGAKYNNSTKNWEIPVDKIDEWNRSIDNIRNKNLSYDEFTKTQPKITDRFQKLYDSLSTISNRIESDNFSRQAIGKLMTEIKTNKIVSLEDFLYKIEKIINNMEGDRFAQEGLAEIWTQAKMMVKDKLPAPSTKFLGK